MQQAEKRSESSRCKLTIHVCYTLLPAVSDLQCSQTPIRSSPKMLPGRWAQCRTDSLQRPPAFPTPPHRSPSSLAHNTQQPQSSTYCSDSGQSGGLQSDSLSHGGQPQAKPAAAPGGGRKEREGDASSRTREKARRLSEWRTLHRATGDTKVRSCCGGGIS